MKYIVVKKDCASGKWLQKGATVYDSFYDALADCKNGERIIIKVEKGMA